MCFGIFLPIRAPSLCSSILKFIRLSKVVWVSSCCVFFLLVFFPSCVFLMLLVRFVKHYVYIPLIHHLFIFGNWFFFVAVTSLFLLFFHNVYTKTITIFKIANKNRTFCFICVDHSQRKRLIVFQTKWQPKFWCLWQNIDWQ